MPTKRLTRHLDGNDIKSNSIRLEKKKNEISIEYIQKRSKRHENTETITKTKRDELYQCMCVKMNELFGQRSITKLFINTLCGSPIYIHMISTILFLGIIATIATLHVLSIPKTAINNSYFANCSSNSDCNSSKGLQCSAQDGICNCPAYKTKGRCDCSKGYYWSGYECKRLFQYLETGCSADYMCDSYKTKYIYCLNKTCKCESNEIFDTTAQKCKYNYLGCFKDDITHPSINSFSYILNAQQSYFVDICLSGCRFRGYNYTIVYRWSNPLCNCVPNFNFFNSPYPTSCDVTCGGKDGERYSCGNVNSWPYRSVYSNF